MHDANTPADQGVASRKSRKTTGQYPDFEDADVLDEGERNLYKSLVCGSAVTLTGPTGITGQGGSSNLLAVQGGLSGLGGSSPNVVAQYKLPDGSSRSSRRTASDFPDLEAGSQAGSGERDSLLTRADPNAYEIPANDYEQAIKKPGKLCLEWRNLNFIVGSGENEKVILKNCYGKLYPGQVCALIGPSGAGKSTLMNILAARQTWGNADADAHSPGGANCRKEGEIRYGGKSVNFQELKKSIGYVMQQDALLGTQTVLETMQFAAKMKMPKDTPRELMDKNVEDTLKQLNLWEVRDVWIGDALIKGISGGQKKRVSAAIELLTRPSVMFLDEPTSGLDSFSSLQLMAILKKIAIQEDSIICCTIHQPSSELFDYFDRVICMRYGEIMFNGLNGKAARMVLEAETLDPIKSLTESVIAGGISNEAIYTVPGFLDLIVRQPIPPNYNPADWLLYLAQSMSEDEARETIEQQARAYEIRNPGYHANRVPLIHYRRNAEANNADTLVQNVMSIDKKNVFPYGQARPGNVGGASSGLPASMSLEGGKTGLDTLFPVMEHEEVQDADKAAEDAVAAALKGSAHMDHDSMASLLSAGMGSGGVIQGHSNSCIINGAGVIQALEVQPLDVENEIHDHPEVGITPDTLKQLHLSKEWRVANPEAQIAIMKSAQLTPFCHQFGYLLRREFTHRFRDPGSLIARYVIPLLQTAFFAYGFGSVARQVARAEYTHTEAIVTYGQYGEKIREVYGSLNNVVWIVLFSSANGFMLCLPAERHIFLREYHSNMYNIVAYVMAKAVVELLILLFQALLVFCLMYFSWGMNGNFIAMFSIFFVLGSAGSAMGLFMACINCNAPERSLMMAPIVLSALPNVFSGAFRPVSQMGWFGYLSYIIPSTHGLRLLLTLENPYDKLKGILEQKLVVRDSIYKNPDDNDKPMTEYYYRALEYIDDDGLVKPADWPEKGDLQINDAETHMIKTNLGRVFKDGVWAIDTSNPEVLTAFTKIVANERDSKNCGQPKIDANGHEILDESYPDEAHSDAFNNYKAISNEKDKKAELTDWKLFCRNPTQQPRLKGKQIATQWEFYRQARFEVLARHSIQPEIDQRTIIYGTSLPVITAIFFIIATFSLKHLSRSLYQ